MPPKKDDKKGGKSKQIQASKASSKGASSSGGGKAKKKKWSKGKVKEKLANLVVFDKPTYDKLLKEVPSYKLITPSIISDRLKVNGSLARRALRHLEDKGLVKRVARHGAQSIYTRATAGKD
eukprot:TRINITY_DN342_c0_g1_i1.p2 TRINITY_DN342_c0_g1~~TRINITY_DN342_c0_g1_i1.p2  ORF type:complete len:122 (-),score=39.38 TRINITY_DN342_c0_g1_i1:93-458(-)